jgi:hypothetical protein
MKTNTITLSNFTKHLNTISALEYLIDILPKCSSDGPWIAGGSLHRTYRNSPLHTSDVDVFFKDKQQMDAYVKELIMGEKRHGKYKTKDYIITEWHQSVTIQYMDNNWKIQCVTFKYFPTVEDLFKSFDINICRLAYDGKQVIGEENVLNEIKSNVIKFNKESIDFPSVTLKRMVKYIKMGYDVNDEELKILSRAFYNCKKKNIIVNTDLSTKKNIDGEEYKNLSTPTTGSLTIPSLTLNVS